LVAIEYSTVQVTLMATERGLSFQADFTAGEFTTRRAGVLDAIGGRAVALLSGAPTPDGYDVFRQWNDFYYLCGVEVTPAYLLVDGRSGKTILYLAKRDEHLERNEGPTLCWEDAERIAAWTGVADVRPVEALAGDLKGTETVYVPCSPAEGSRMCRDTLRAARRAADADPWNRRISAEDNFLARVRDAATSAEIRDLSPILDKLRLVKSPSEVALMRRAGRLSALAVTEAIRSTRPGVTEYQLGATADYLFLASGTRGGAYRPIISSGPNIWLTHYCRNDRSLEANDLVLMDYAPDVRYYTSDIGRMWPVGGRYSNEQRELYGLIVEYHHALLRHIRPEVLPAQVMREAADEMRPRIEGRRFSTSARRDAARRLLEFSGHLSHGVGMAVHDVGDYHRYSLRPGTVFALDPQMWVPEERLYIRVEDTIAVTGDGYENLTAMAPLELDDVERAMREPGMLQASRPAAFWADDPARSMASS
jgi:Xaa-Pro aminopeptidase